MIEEAQAVDFQKTDSILEALILESQLIKKHQPKYNVREKDDRSFNYVVITDEDFPQVYVIRQREIVTKKFKGRIKYAFGPFPQGGILKEALVIVRKIFPFRDKKCIPQSGRPCFNRQIGLCPGVCTGEITKKEYQKTIRNIRLLFGGKKSMLLKKLIKEMKEAAKRYEFEHAAILRNAIFSLNHIQDVSLIRDDLQPVDKSVNKSIPSLPAGRQGRTLEKLILERIEAYDVAHMAGKEIVGVMVVVEEGTPEKNDYRKFKVRTIQTSNDTGALKEILERRLKHKEWPLPDLIVVDGGKAQINVACRVLRQSKVRSWVVGVVKDERHRPKKIIGDRRIVHKYEKEILLANSEAHRFALRYHRKRRAKFIEVGLR